MFPRLLICSMNVTYYIIHMHVSITSCVIHMRLVLYTGRGPGKM